MQKYRTFWSHTYRHQIEPSLQSCGAWKIKSKEQAKTMTIFKPGTWQRNFWFQK